MFAALVLASVVSADAGVPPKGLACLPTWYAGTVTFARDAGWGLSLADAGFIPWHDPAAADDDEELTDLEELFRTPYPTGPIVPIETADAGAIAEPGRARVVQLLKATYGETRDEVTQHLGRVRFFGLRYPFHEKAAPALERVVERLKPDVKKYPKLLPFLKDIGGTWIWRRIARSKQLSAHAWGIAIDINAERSAYWRWAEPREPIVWQNRIPQVIVDAFEAEGFIWGGRWQHYDTMHFEYRPELLSAACHD